MKNWSGAVPFEPARYLQPRTISELGRLLDGPRPIRVVGAGHSFSPVAATTGTLINLDHLSGIVGVNRQAKRVRFLAGTRLRDIPDLLAPYGLALPNQGDVNPQSLAGAISTGTHGTGLAFTGFAGTVTGLTLLGADGTFTEVDESDPNFTFYQLTLGLLGIITEVEMQCVDRFDMVADETTVNFEQIRTEYADRAKVEDHIEFFWFPGQDDAILKVNTRLAPGESSDVPERSKVARMISEEVLDNGALRLACEIARLVPALNPAIGSVATKLGGGRAYRAAAHDVFVSPRRVKFHEMEYAVPLESGAEVLAEMKRVIEAKDLRLSFPLEVRCAKGDEVAMSTAYGRDSMYIAIHQFVKEDPRPYFEAMEPIFQAAGGRPHWGKMNSLTRADVLERYPKAAEFASLVASADPDGIFTTEHVAHLR